MSAADPDRVLTIEEAAAAMGTDPARLAERLGIEHPTGRPRLRVIPGGQQPDDGPVFTEQEHQWFASTDALLTARQARQDAEQGLPMLQPVDLDAHDGPTAATDPTVTPRTPDEINDAWDAIDRHARNPRGGAR